MKRSHSYVPFNFYYYIYMYWQGLSGGKILVLKVAPTINKTVLIFCQFFFNFLQKCTANINCPRAPTRNNVHNILKQINLNNAKKKAKMKLWRLIQCLQLVHGSKPYKSLQNVMVTFLSFCSKTYGITPTDNVTGV